MNENKQLKVFNVKTEEFEIITPNDMAAMMPSFSKDGNKVFYSAGR